MNPSKTGEQGKALGEGDDETGRAPPGSAAVAADLRDAARTGQAPARPGSEDSETQRPDDSHVSRR